MITISNDNQKRVDAAIDSVLEKCLRHLDDAGELLGDTGDIESQDLDDAAEAIQTAIRKVWQFRGRLDDVD